MAEDRRKQQAWRSGSARPAFVEPGKKPRGGGKRFAVITLILVVVGVVAGLLIYLRPAPKPIFLGVAVTQYANRSYPPNPWAQQDSDKLREHFEADSAQAFQAQEKKGLLDLLIQLADRTGQSKDKGRPVVALLSAHAISREGKVYLLPGRAEPDNRSTWLSLEDVLGALRRGSGPRLLLLDLARPTADAHAGLLADNVANAIDDELTRIDQAGDLPFLVLTACGKGEVAHASLELQRSVFGFFLEQGLLGHADGWNEKREPDGRVSARELAEYVKAQVAAWAKAMRLPPQTPVLYGKGKDFVLISPKRPFPAVQLPEVIAAYPEWLQKGWQERDKWVAAESNRQAPMTFRELESLLLQSEERWLAADPEDVIKSELAGKTADLVKQRDDLALKSFAPYSIAQARKLGFKDEKAVASAIRPLLERIQSKIPIKPDDLKPLGEKPPEPAPFGAIASQTLAALLEIPDPPPEQIKEFDAILKVFSPPPRFIELAAIRLLVDFDPRVQEKWNDKSLAGVRRLVLSAARASEEAAAFDPRCLPWLKSELSAADVKHREGLIQLTSGGSDARLDGQQKLKDAIEAFDQITQKAQLLERAFQRLEDARVLLPELVRPLGRRPTDPADSQLWSTIVDQVFKLQKLLTPDPSVRLASDDVSSITQQLQVNLVRLRSRFQSPEADRQIRLSNADNGPTADDLRRLMDAALWTGPDRLRLYNTGRDIGQTAAKSAIDQATSLKPGGDSSASGVRRVDDPAWRARLAIDLLRLDGATEVQPLEEALNRASAGGKPADWEHLADAIRKAWAVALPEKYRGLTDLAARERAATAIQAVDLSALPDSPDRPPMESTPELRRRQERELWLWLASERYRKFADALLKIADRPDLAAYANRLEEIGRQLQSRVP
jgi:hypothetical protein